MNQETLIMKYKKELRNFNYQIQKKLNNLLLSNTKKNQQTLVNKYKEKLQNFNYQVQRRIANF